MSDGGQWGDAMREIRHVRDHLQERIDMLELRLRQNTPTLRDRFAMAALVPFIEEFWGGGPDGDSRVDDMAVGAYQVADAMLRAREGK